MKERGSESQRLGRDGGVFFFLSGNLFFFGHLLSYIYTFIVRFWLMFFWLLKKTKGGGGKSKPAWLLAGLVSRVERGIMGCHGLGFKGGSGYDAAILGSAKRLS